MVAGSKRERASGSSTLLEAMALRFGLCTAIQCGIPNLILETDSEILARSLRGVVENDNYVMVLIQDIQEAAQLLPCSEFRWISRKANQVAHALAHYGFERNFEEIWMEEVPGSCMHFILKDVRREPNLSI